MALLFVGSKGGLVFGFVLLVFALIEKLFFLLLVKDSDFGIYSRIWKEVDCCK